MLSRRPNRIPDKPVPASTADHRAHLMDRVAGSHQSLPCGLTPPARPPAHAVDTLDWSRPTVGERDHPVEPPDPGRHQRVVAVRKALTSE